MTASKTIPFRFHPRVFAALGADLVTNDIVAVMELVKNSYDALARNVHIRFGKDAAGRDYLEIEDDGQGMTRDVIENVWCVVATPYRKRERIVRAGGRRRRVSGEKGLGRLAAARLGDRLRMWTRAPNGPCWEVTVRWSSLAATEDLSHSVVELTEYTGSFPSSGTRIRIGDLARTWDLARLSDLRSSLSRLASPFSQAKDFCLHMPDPELDDATPVRIEPTPFLLKPKYCIDGNVDAAGNLSARYRFTPIADTAEKRSVGISLGWEQINKGGDNIGTPSRNGGPQCGPFTFEIRAWDIATDDLREIAHHYGIVKSGMIRAAIRSHMGISVYRDDILVLPKSDSTRDWMELDLRRVSRLTRLSTNQIVGYVSISAEQNTGIRDTSDRERLAVSSALTNFRKILLAAVESLENERESDRPDPNRERPMVDLFVDMSPDDLLSETESRAAAGQVAAAVLPSVRSFSERSQTAIKSLQGRLVYYSRLATVGTIAQMLVHEILNRTTAIGRFLISMRSRLRRDTNLKLSKERDRAQRAVEALERLADTFAPLANRGFRRGRRSSILEVRIRECLEIGGRPLRELEVRCEVPETSTAVAVDPGELDTVLLNLISNAAYWLRGLKSREKKIVFSIRKKEVTDRIEVEVADSGRGIPQEDLERIFLPGITRKPGGIGMGLTVASEVVAAYDGRMYTRAMEEGAVFVFDLPTAKES